MKKITKLLIPGIALISAITVVTPLLCLTSCGQKPTTTRDVEIIDSTSTVSFTKTMLTNGSIQISLSCSSKTKKINSIQSIVIGTTTLIESQYTFANNKITITKAILDTYAGKISITPELVDKEVTDITLDVSSKEIDPNESFNIKASLTYENSNTEITWTVNKENIITLDKTTSGDGEVVKVTGNMGGEVTLTATCNGHSATCSITVTTKTITLTPDKDAFEGALIELTSYNSQTITNAANGTNKATWTLKDGTTSTVQRFKIILNDGTAEGYTKTIEVPKGATSFEVELTNAEWVAMLDEATSNLEPEYVYKTASVDVTQSDFTTYFQVDESQTSKSVVECNEGYSSELTVVTTVKQAVTGRFYLTIKSDSTKQKIAYAGTVTLTQGQPYTNVYAVMYEYWANINYDDTLEVHFEVS